VYVLMRCPRTEFENALQKERTLDDMLGDTIPESKATDSN